MLFELTSFLLIGLSLESQYANGRREILLEPYQSLGIRPPAQPSQRRLDQANAFSKLRNFNHVKYKPVQANAKSNPVSHAAPPRVLQTNSYVEKLLSVKTKGLKRKKSAKDAYLNHEEDKTYTVRKDQLLALRARWSKKCDKAAAKECAKACKKAEKSACSDYKCRKNLKKKFRKECKRQCKRRFISRSGC